jgi:hypothetical protein
MDGTGILRSAVGLPVMDNMDSKTPWNNFSNETGISIIEMEQAGHRWISVFMPFMLCCMWMVAGFLLHFSQVTRVASKHPMGNKYVYPPILFHS